MDNDDIDREIYRTFYGSPDESAVASPPKKRVKPNNWVYDNVNAIIAELIPIYQHKLSAKCGNMLHFDYNAVTYYMDENDMQYEFMLLQGENNAAVSCETSFIPGTTTQPGELTFTLDSITEDILRGRKYNLFLRAFVIHMACVVQMQLQRHNISVYVISQAVNPVSLYTLAKYFTVEVYDVNGFQINQAQVLKTIQDYLVTHSPPVFNDIKRIYNEASASANGSEDNDISVMIMIDCNANNDRAAVQLIRQLLLPGNGGLVCGNGNGNGNGVGGSGSRRRKRNRKRKGRYSRRYR